MANFNKCMAEAFDSTKSYEFGSLVMYNDKLYQCINSEYSAGEFAAEDWEENHLVDVLGMDKTYVNTLAPAYDNTATYSVDDKVLHNQRLYVCNTAIESGEDFDDTKWDETTLSEIIENSLSGNSSIDGELGLEINIKTKSVGAGDASIIVTIYANSGNAKKLLKTYDIVFTNANVNCMDVLQINYDSAKTSWVATALVPITYGNTEHGPDTTSTVASWSYSVTKDMTMYVGGDGSVINRELGESFLVTDSYTYNGTYNGFFCANVNPAGINSEMASVYVNFEDMLVGTTSYNSRKQNAITTKSGTVKCYGLNVEYTENSITFTPTAGQIYRCYVV